MILKQCFIVDWTNGVLVFQVCLSAWEQAGQKHLGDPSRGGISDQVVGEL